MKTLLKVAAVLVFAIGAFLAFFVGDIGVKEAVGTALLGLGVYAASDLVPD